MFTGIVEGLGELRRILPRAASYTYFIDLKELAEGVRIGDSIAVNGVCLTVTSLDRELASFDVITETVARTNFSTLKVGQLLNLERSMPANGRFHGHIVSGHVDGCARLSRVVKSPGQTLLSFSAEAALTEQMIHKGSITIDGISLTLTEVTDSQFSVALIPHTWSVTALSRKREGDLVNIEVDQIGKWVRALLSRFVPGVPPPKTGSTGLGVQILKPEDLGKYLG